MQTVPLDLSTDNLTLSFSYAVGTDGCDPIEIGVQDERPLLEYSVNNGNSWTLWTNYSNGKGQASLPVPAAAQTNRTILRWRQLSYSTSLSQSDVWAISDVSVGLRFNVFAFREGEKI